MQTFEVQNEQTIAKDCACSFMRQFYEGMIRRWSANIIAYIRYVSCRDIIWTVQKSHIIKASVSARFLSLCTEMCRGGVSSAIDSFAHSGRPMLFVTLTSTAHHTDVPPSCKYRPRVRSVLALTTIVWVCSTATLYAHIRQVVTRI